MTEYADIQVDNTLDYADISGSTPDYEYTFWKAKSTAGRHDGEQPDHV